MSYFLKTVVFDYKLKIKSDISRNRLFILKTEIIFTKNGGLKNSLEILIFTIS